MEVIRLSKPSSRGAWLTCEAPAIVDALGKPEFEARLFAVIRDAVGCAMMEAITVDENRRKRLVFSAGQLPCADPPVLDWSPDAILLPDESLREGVLVRSALARHGGADQARRVFGAKPVERQAECIALLRRHEGIVLCLKFYSDSDSGRFRPADVQRLDGACEFMIALVAKHRALLPAADSLAELRLHHEDLLRQIAPILSRREQQVCACIAAGLSSEAIALTLGIKLNTVLTHRKHAYNRLNISSQNELLRKILTPRQSDAALRYAQPQFDRASA